MDSLHTAFRRLVAPGVQVDGQCSTILVDEKLSPGPRWRPVDNRGTNASRWTVPARVNHRVKGQVTG